MFWGFLGGLTVGFREKRPSEGWLGAFNRACRVIVVFYLAVILIGIGWFFVHRYYVEPQAAERRQRHNECIDAKGPVPYGVMQYPADYWADACKHLEP